jgi:hypothetical protein
VINELISIQPLGRFWQEPESSQATGMALARCILGKFLGVVCHCIPLSVCYCGKILNSSQATGENMAHAHCMLDT